MGARPAEFEPSKLRFPSLCVQLGKKKSDGSPLLDRIGILNSSVMYEASSVTNEPDGIYPVVSVCKSARTLKVQRS